MPTVVALVGTSKSKKNGIKMIDEDELVDRIDDALDLIETEFDDMANIEIWSGSGSVPIAMYKRLCDMLYGPEYVLCGCEKVKRGYFKDKSVKQEIVGKDYGDESEHLIQHADMMIKIGGGPQAEKEYKMFLQRKPNNPCYDLYLSYEPRTTDSYLEDGATPNAQRSKTNNNGGSIYSSKHVRQQTAKAGW